MWEKRYGKEANHIKIRTRETKNTKRNERNTRQDLQQLEEGSKGDDEGSRQKPLWGADKLARAPRSHNSQPQGLHPSWAAKKQTQKVLQAKPQGQLVVFDDDGNAHVPSGADPSVKKKKEETVHPSWAAKMRERQRLTSIQGAHMQGQKIVFDFD
ncbi:hypothetical protein EV182_001965 [Spiromyces aspiralis]|uniref:Uncharacterized protein n=1 Tax=Spiromyces aspiralis TaxID=68401 RepID=A0ACC1HET6_9FUNG|nr:hypothetical protein EV182_001965 [Spiromyces aspiralis]